MWTSSNRSKPSPRHDRRPYVQCSRETRVLRDGVKMDALSQRVFRMACIGCHIPRMRAPGCHAWPRVRARGLQDWECLPSCRPVALNRRRPWHSLGRTGSAASAHTAHNTETRPRPHRPVHPWDRARPRAQLHALSPCPPTAGDGRAPRASRPSRPPRPVQNWPCHPCFGRAYKPPLRTPAHKTKSVPLPAHNPAGFRARHLGPGVRRGKHRRR